MRRWGAKAALVQEEADSVLQAIGVAALLLVICTVGGCLIYMAM